MSITFRYTSQLAGAAGTSEEIVEAGSDADLLGLLRNLSAKHGHEFAKFVVDAEGDAVPTLVVALNGVQVSLDDPVALGEGDEVMLITPMSGG